MTRALGEDGVPVVWSGEAVEQLPLPNTYGRAAAAAGDWIVGLAFESTGSHPAVWRDRKLVGVVRDLPGFARTIFDMNESGQYVGAYTSLDGGNLTYGGFIGVGTDVRILNWPGFPQPRPEGINDDSTIVGGAVVDGLRVGLIARAGADADRLLPLEGDAESAAGAINNHDTVVGVSVSASGNETASVYLNGSLTPTDMNTLIDPIPGVHLVVGIDINDAGQILVEGADTTAGVYRYYILTPVPEPASSMALLLTGLIVIGSRRAACGTCASAQLVVNRTRSSASRRRRSIR